MTENAKYPAKNFVGRWMRSATHRNLGFGYCRRRQGTQYVLSYVDLPGVAEHQKLVDSATLIDEPIPHGTRIWVKGDPYGWHAGEIKRTGTRGRYYVGLIGIHRELLLYQDQFYVRWSNPLDQPVLAIQHGLSEAPTFYEARSALLSELVRQRGAARGLSSVISAPINLYQHQIDTVARVLADPVIRYLLADEVGLGKTIEAGLVIRQMLIDDPNASILVLAPENLVGQWTSELRDRLALGIELEDRRLAVQAHEELAESAELSIYALVVVDEAHHLLALLSQDSPVELALSKIDALLALSATPMRGDLNLFRRLLSLVDPIAFRGMTEESLLQRLNQRERSARDLQVLVSRRASVRQKSAVVESLKEMFAEDGNILQLADRCAQSDDATGPPWLALADYVRETYRLSRRMIRHRRGGELVEGYAVSGRQPRYVEIDDPARSCVDGFLDLYRLRLEGGDQGGIFSDAAVHALAGAKSLHEFLTSSLHLPKDHPSAPRNEDRSLFEATIDQLELTGLDARLNLALDLVLDRVNKGQKIVVCSSFQGLARAFHERAANMLDECQLFEHLGTMAPSLRDDAVAHFLAADGGAVLTADRTMEEGRNLQEAEVLVNLDLPLDASRLDQRIGRMDRYSFRPNPAEVVVFTESSSEWVSAQVRLLAEGIGVLDGSVSTVQRMLNGVLQAVLKDLLPRGVDALNIDARLLRAQLDEEREDIDLLEEMESVTAATVFGGEAFSALVEYEESDELLRSALQRLTHGTGALALKPVEWPTGVVKFTGAGDIGLPRDEVPALARLMSVPKTFARNIAVNGSGAAPFRIGDSLVDWLHRYLRADERGRAYAVVRPAPGLSTPTLWLHSEFLIEFDKKHLSTGEEATRRGLARRGDALLPPIRFETWTDPFGQAPEGLVRGVLDLDFDDRRDKVLRGRIWKPVLDEFPAWHELVRQSAEVARSIVDNAADVKSRRETALDAARHEIGRRHAILRARSLRLPTEQERIAAFAEFDLETAVGDALIAGIQGLSVRMAACGVCVLWPEEAF